MGDEREFKERYGPWGLVTGASAGIGAEFARQLARKGLNVILVARRAELLGALAAELEREHAVETRTVAVDLTEPGFMDAIRAASSELEVGLLVNNAGTAVGGGFLEGDLELHRRTLELNATAPLVLSHELGRGMEARGRGGIVFLSSMIALQGVGNWANYAATKSYELTLADGLAFELKPKGIDVLTLLPGPTLTEGTVNMGATADGGPMKFKPPEAIVAAALASLGRRSIVVPGAMNRLMGAVTSRAMSRSRRTKLWARMMSMMGMSGQLVSSPQARAEGPQLPRAVGLDG